MRSPAETKFHLLMSTLVIASVLADQELPKLLPQWHMPAVGLVTCTLGLCWVGRIGAQRLAHAQQRLRVLEDRLDRLQQRTDALEHDSRARRGLPRP